MQQGTQEISIGGGNSMTFQGTARGTCVDMTRKYIVKESNMRGDGNGWEGKGSLYRGRFKVEVKFCLRWICKG